MDGLFPAANTSSAHDTQLVEQCRTEISALQPEHNVFLIGTTNHVDQIDPAITRGGRFSEKIVIGAPGQEGRERLLRKYLKNRELEFKIERMAERLAGLAPADIEAICKSAIGRAFGRSERDDYIPPLNCEDFEKAIKKVTMIGYNF
jgi:transitional endoplasmic reticulum ATPase